MKGKKAKVKSGQHLLFTQGFSNKWSDIKDKMIVNLIDKYTYLSFSQKKNHLFIETTLGKIDIVFTGEPPKLEFESYCKDQLILKIIP